MKASIAAFAMTILVASAEPAATQSLDPYGIIKKPIPDKTVVLTFEHLRLAAHIL